MKDKDETNPVIIYCTNCGEVPISYKSVAGVVVVFCETCGLVITDQAGKERFVEEFLMQYHIEVDDPEKTELPLTPDSICAAIQLCAGDRING